MPGLRVFNVSITEESTIEVVKQELLKPLNEHLLSADLRRAGKSWLVYTSFGVGAEFNLILEEEAVELPVQARAVAYLIRVLVLHPSLSPAAATLDSHCLQRSAGAVPARCLCPYRRRLITQRVHSNPLQLVRLQSTFGLDLIGDPSSADCRVHWDSRSRFELVLFSLLPLSGDGGSHEPFTFRHEERVGAPGTLIAESLIEPYLRAWDFVGGEAYRSSTPLIFSYSDDLRSRRDFMMVSMSKPSEQQQFVEGTEGAGGLLGMGANAIVHHVELEAVRKEETELASPQIAPRILRRESTDDIGGQQAWDAAVKRPFSLAKMLASMENKAEAGVAKRLRMAGALNRQGRLLYFYGLGIALACNNAQRDEYKFEATLLSQFQEDFSSYTLKAFTDDYTAVTARWLPSRIEKERVEALQERFTLIKVKVLLVSLLNGFRDLTLMGVQAFDFNHLSNVLISRDYRKARLIDIDGASKGSIQFPSQYIEGDADDDTHSVGEGSSHEVLHKPALDIDLSTLLPEVVRQLMFGKGRGKPFVEEQVSRVRRAKTEEEAKAVIRTVLRENFFPELPEGLPDGAEHTGDAPALDTHHTATSLQQKHLSKVVEWFHDVLLKRGPWSTWTNDIYDAMRCIDHLPIG